MKKPILLVDIDGVINAFGPGLNEDEVESFTFQGFKMRVPLGTAERIAKLEVAFDPVWATTWETDAPILGRHFGFGFNWRVIEFEIGGHRVRASKIPGVKAWCDQHAFDRPVAFIDDDLGSDADVWADGRPQTLLVRPNPGWGLTELQAQGLLNWAGERTT